MTSFYSILMEELHSNNSTPNELKDILKEISLEFKKSNELKLRELNLKERKLSLMEYNLKIKTKKGDFQNDY